MHMHAHARYAQNSRPRPPNKDPFRDAKSSILDPGPSEQGLLPHEPILLTRSFRVMPGPGFRPGPRPGTGPGPGPAAPGGGSDMHAYRARYACICTIWMHMHDMHAYAQYACICTICMHMHICTICMHMHDMHDMHAYARYVCICTICMHMHDMYAYACICTICMHMHDMHAYA